MTAKASPTACCLSARPLVLFFVMEPSFFLRLIGIPMPFWTANRLVGTNGVSPTCASAHVIGMTTSASSSESGREEVLKLCAHNRPHINRTRRTMERHNAAGTGRTQLGLKL